jgi:MoxR-vWA-beta-propeller ternary system domain bpX4
MKNNFYLKMLQQLRQQEEIMLYGNMLKITAEEETEAGLFLSTEYEREALEYPFTVPDFDRQAALWGARTVYIAAQLMLYREHKAADLEWLLPPFAGQITAAAFVAADLSLRFLPPVLNHLKWIDPEDSLIPVLENHLHTWHYSGVAYPLEADKLNLDMLRSDRCLHQLYVNRVIQHKRLPLAHHPVLKDTILSNLGIFTDECWGDFKNELSKNDSY